ncbi:hypothetical protein AB0P17_27445 [Streptomyces sp. NPDC088124]|uniref:hypothetical protein n=1 Tax=Streptomyces sp. NPDC088124 TaxID=3154654 RepID=UPI00343AB47B
MTGLEGRTATGGGCRALAHRPRFPNVMPDVDEFLGRWKAPAAPRRPTRLRRSTDGNINTVGLPGIHEADDVHSGHPQWRAAIEDGVWTLVDTLTTGAWRLATYDSCEGHAYRPESLAPGRRRVGVLPRSPREFTRAAAALCRGARRRPGRSFRCGEGVGDELGAHVVGECPAGRERPAGQAA